MFGQFLFKRFSPPLIVVICDSLILLGVTNVHYCTEMHTFGQSYKHMTQ